MIHGIQIIIIQAVGGSVFTVRPYYHLSYYIVSREVGWLIWVYITSFIWHLIIPSLVLLSPCFLYHSFSGTHSWPPKLSSHRSEDLKLNAASVMLWSQLGYHSNTAAYSAAKILNYLSGYKPIMSALCNYLIINQCHWN